MASLRVPVNLGPRSYSIAISSGDADGLAAFARQAVPKSNRALVVVDAAIPQHADLVERNLQAAGWQTRRVTIPSGEASKSTAELSRLWDVLADWPADRKTLVVAVGGGVIGDLAGFAAATYARGLPLLMVPTTLLSMVDSSVGGKTGINHPSGKNLIGAFHQPAAVWIDTAFLDTLPEREFLSGLAEVIKYGVILDADFFAYLEAHADAIRRRDADAIRRIVARSCELKAVVVEQDEREETGLRAILNYGHTFAHVFETIGGYGAWLHGEAVAAGMVCASRLAEKQGLISAELTERQRRLLARFDLPIAPKSEWPIDPMIAGMYRDKKTELGRLRFILPTKLGHVELRDDVPETAAREILQTAS
ncbi:3-dehydroquinate synthase [Tuwongella immobilis]|uniref:3-dehydroquinate synthase n=1 Tax=Tuwongella immobilis TaxID=692036 RepID=A0A6C2YSD4_9BACT|nr:3-dehydroquinate synthase [Tuwongella immobilis]VIP04376.1 3-dehydroquinate synthase : 3-dehydroquinate synthase OS=Blastopirellula marina DSM 3645 GN=aroB PE=3 SV=1: DHQ_synthase [Tuwongella immobilis]VTS06114.1 3-dehydroquinate synthase : 3-dehydroquinate synthase OS=Blastopirellula marina DSM 3645 GN=aroB PE=3 SV=1: DHQ_synthase [Tuwongella immobilis]